MGLYDSVKRRAIKCPTCGEKITCFQSKSGFRQMLTVTPKQLIEDYERCWRDEDGPVYSGYCDHCRTVVDFEWIPGHWEKSHETWEEQQARWKREEEEWKKQSESAKKIL